MIVKGKRIICKHIVVTYFAVFPRKSKEYKEEQEKLQQEYEK